MTKIHGLYLGLAIMWTIDYFYFSFKNINSWAMYLTAIMMVIFYSIAFQEDD